ELDGRGTGVNSGLPPRREDSYFGRLMEGDRGGGRSLDNRIFEGGATQYLVQAVNKWDGNDQDLAQGKVEDIKAWIASDSLFNGWILGSLSEEAVTKVINRLTS
nr:ankyrin repeat-containing domain, PGG domain protein [Tanacetum cinerariifolium]